MSYTYETQHNSGIFTPEAQAKKVFGMARKIEGYTLHWWGDPSNNPSYEGVRDYLCRAGGNTSAHLVVTGTGRRVSCIVNYNDVAWHSGSAWGNARTIGIELDPRCREEDKDVFAEVLCDLRSAFGDLPLYWHSYFTPTSCPGVYQALVDDLDARSYQKVSGAEWGNVSNLSTTPAPTPSPVPPVVSTPTTTPQAIAFKVYDSTGKQVGAYNVEANAYRAFVTHGGNGTITQDGIDVTQDFITKFRTPSPTATPPEQGGGLPATEKPDYSEENNALLKSVKTTLEWLVSFIKSIFKGGN